MHLSAISIYPVKSGAGLSLAEARVEARGLRHDRRFMVVDQQLRFITARQEPRLMLVRALPAEGWLGLHAPGMEPMRVLAPEGNADRMPVRVWGDEVDAAACDAAAEAWLSRFLGREVRLAYMDGYARRGVDPHYGRADDTVSFADGFPLLAISQAALDDLNARLAAPLPMNRFRPNLVIAGSEPHAEDGWRRVRIGAVEFDFVKPCTRCVATTVDHESGTFDPSGEPLNTLKTYRRGSSGITFGQNLLPRGAGTVRVGDDVEVLEHLL